MGLKPPARFSGFISLIRNETDKNPKNMIKQYRILWMAPQFPPKFIPSDAPERMYEYNNLWAIFQ